MQLTAILLSYNCERFVLEALRGVLQQNCEPMQVIVSDDASTDRTYAILDQEIAGYSGLHQIDLRRRANNSGSKSAHLNDVLPLARGEVIVFFDGDDVSRLDRVARLVPLFEDAEVMAAFSAHALIDASGRRLGSGDVPHPKAGASSSAWFAPIGAYASGGTLAIRRQVFDAFGGLDPRIHEDVVLPFRAGLLGKVHYIDEELVSARRHQSLTQNSADFADMASYRARHLQGIQAADRKYRSRLADIETARQLMPDHAAALDGLRSIVARSVVDAKASAGLVSASVWSRLRSLWALSRSPLYRDKLGRDLLLVVTPRTYLRYKRFKLRSGRERG